MDFMEASFIGSVSAHRTKRLIKIHFEMDELSTHFNANELFPELLQISNSSFNFFCRIQA